MAEELPQELWAQVLQHVPYKQRLSVCALVCHKLARAATAATQSLSLRFARSPHRHSAFLGWASSHGRSLTKLHLSDMPYTTTIRQLPCTHLVELRLSMHKCSVQLCAGSQGVGLLHSCTALTKLELERATLLDGGGGLAAGMPATAAARLKHVGVQFCQLPEGTEEAGTVARALQDRLFPGLSCLTHFRLDAWMNTDDNTDNGLQSCLLRHVSTLTSLQELSLAFTGQLAITTATLPGIERLTALKDLSIKVCGLEPSCLLPMTTGLTRVYLESVTLQPRQAQQDSELGAAQLLQVLARLTALRQLTLERSTGEWPQQQLSTYSALTASSNLQELHIGDNSIPAAAWAHVFPAGRKLPHLHSLDAEGPSRLGSAGIDRLASCCPALQRATIDTRAEASLAPFTSLTALTSLELRNSPVSPAAIRSDLAALSQLQLLQFKFSQPAPGPDGVAASVLQQLAPLTALTGLTRFWTRGHRGIDVWFKSRAPPGAPPDVWAQLLEKCAADQASQQ